MSGELQYQSDALACRVAYLTLYEGKDLNISLRKKTAFTI